MEGLLNSLLKGDNPPLLIIVVFLLAKDFFERRQSRQQVIDEAVMAATLKAIQESLARLCERFDQAAGKGGGFWR